MSVGGVGTAAPNERTRAIRSRLVVQEGWPWRMLLVTAWLASLVYVGRHLNQGWVPHDDGAFAQSAQRVLDGELPHRDFTELYSGGLTFLNAATFGLFGENLIWLRVPMFLLFAAYLPCVYALARRFAPPLASLLVAAFAVAWGPATYPAAVPSWYLLFFSVFGALSLVRYLETRRARWLVVGGFFGGLAITFKIVGVWYVLAALLFLVVVEQEAHPKSERRRMRLDRYGVLVVTFVGLGLSLVLLLMHSHLGGAELGSFLVPLGAVLVFVIANEARVEGPGSRERLSETRRLVVPFLIGVVAPIVALLIPYIVTGSVADIMSGALVSPRSRLQETYVGTPDPAVFLVAVPIALALVGRCLVQRAARRLIDWTAVIALVALLVTSNGRSSYMFLWSSARGLAPFVVVAGTAALAIGSERFAPREARRGVFLLLALAAFGGLVQFPFGAPIYFCYVAPLIVLAAVASLRYAGAAGGLLPVAVLVTYTLFGLIWLDRGAIYFFGAAPYTNPQTVILDHRIASIRVTPADRAVYRSAVALLRRHAQGSFAYAGPDTPELYFLSGRKNPTRSLFDFLDTSDSARGTALLDALAARHVTAIAINLRPKFSDRLDPSTLRRLRHDYPAHVRVGQFVVRWQGSG